MGAILDSNGLPEIIGLLKGPVYGLEALEAALSSNVSGLPGILSVLNDNEFGLQSLKRTLEMTIVPILEIIHRQVNGLNANNTQLILQEIMAASADSTNSSAAETNLILIEIQKLSEEITALELMLTNSTSGLGGIKGRTVAKKMQDYNTCSKSIYLFCK